MRIHRLCTSILEAIHEMDRLDAPYSIGVVTQLQPLSRSVRTRGRGSHGRGTRHTPVVSDATSIDIRAPHHEPQSRGPRTRGREAHRMRTSHTSDFPSAPLVNISRLPMDDTHITHVEVPSTPLVVPLIASSPQPLEAMSNDEESTPTTNVDQERQDDDHGRGRGRRCGRRHGRQEHERVHASPIEPMVAHHGCPIRKRKAHLCGTH